MQAEIMDLVSIRREREQAIEQRVIAHREEKFVSFARRAAKWNWGMIMLLAACAMFWGMIVWVL